MASENLIWFQITLLLVVSVASHFLVSRMRQPMIIGEILIGVAIGFLSMELLSANIIDQPIIDPDLVKFFAQLGSIILLFSIGLECDISKIYTKRNMVIATGGVIVPWIVGFLVFQFMVPSASLAEAIFVGTMLVATSVAVTASVLREMRMISTGVGAAILGAAVVDDVLGMVVLAISKGAVGGEINALNILYLVLIAGAFIVIGVWAGRKYICRMISFVDGKGRTCGLDQTGFVLAFAIALLYAFIAESIGISAIVGAFVAGTVFASLPLKGDFEQGTKYLGAIFIPVFFVSAGLMFNVNGLMGILLVTVVITVLAVVTKMIGCGIPARLMGMTSKESLAVGVGMAPRLEVAMVIAIYGLNNGIITQDVYSMAIFVGLATALLTPTLFRWALSRQTTKENENEGNLPTPR